MYSQLVRWRHRAETDRNLLQNYSNNVVTTIGCTACACQWLQPSIEMSTGTDVVKMGPFFFLQPFGCSSQWNWGSIWELHKVSESSSLIACNVVIPFAMLSSICFMKNWYWDHFLCACAASISHEQISQVRITHVVIMMRPPCRKMTLIWSLILVATPLSIYKV